MMLNLLLFEEAHLADDVRRSHELDPLPVSIGGVTWMIGVGMTRICEFKKGGDGRLRGSVAVVPVDETIADCRKKYGQAGVPGARDDAPSMLELGCLRAAGGKIGDILTAVANRFSLETTF